MSLGLCLAGGGIKGAVHVGALKALEEADIKVDYIGGASSGSIVAALYASGLTPDEIYEIFKRYCKKIKYVDIANVLKLILGLITTGKIKIDGLNSGRQIERLISKECKKVDINNISDIRMPLVIPAVDMSNGEVLCFTSKKIRDALSDDINFINDIDIGRAVRASCSYPGVFSPCPYKGRKLLDGGIRENVPWKETKLIGADKALNIVFENEIDSSCCDNLIEVAGRSLEILCHELSNYELTGSDITIKIKTQKVGLLDMKKVDELYELGYSQVKSQIKNIRKLL